MLDSFKISRFKHVQQIVKMFSLRILAQGMWDVYMELYMCYGEGSGVAGIMCIHDKLVCLIGQVRTYCVTV